MKTILIILLFVGVVYSQGNAPDRLVRQSELGYISVKSYGAVGDSLTDDTNAFQNAINAGDKIFIPEGVYTVDSLVLDSNTEITGVGNGSKLCLKAGGTVLFDITTDDAYLGLGLKDGIKISNLWLSGLAESAFAYANPIGTRVGIHLDNVNNVNIDNCKITGFTLGGIVGEATNGSVTYCFNNQVTRCNIQFNYYGIWLKEKLEYSFFSDNLIQYYNQGIKLIGGNNTFTNNQVLNGVTGMMLESGTNEAHGSFTGGSINHNSYASIWADSVRNGFNFTNVSLWYGHILLNYSRAIRIMNSTIITDTIIFSGGDCANSGFLNCLFNDTDVEITRDKSVDQSIMKNNNFYGTLAGIDDIQINDIDFVPAILDISGLPTMEYSKVDSSYTTVTSNDNINFGDKDFTIEWFGYIRTDSTFQNLVDKSAGSTGLGYKLSIDADNALQFEIVGSSSDLKWGTSPHLESGYYHFVATKQDTNMYFYINGDSTDELIRPLFTIAGYTPGGMIRYSSTSTSNAYDLRIGSLRNPSSWFFNGGMNLVRLYNFAATPTEAVSMFTEGQPSLSEVPYKYKWGSQDSLTSGTLEAGKTYIIDDWVTGDDFANVGGTNADSSIFIATGTLPTDWTNSSIVRKLGCVAEYRAENADSTYWYDNSTNGLDGTNNNVIQNPSVYTNAIDRIIAMPDTASITAGYVPKKQSDGTVLWQPDISTSGTGTFNPDGLTIDTTALGLARVLPAKVTKWDSVSYKQNLEATLTDIADGTIAENLVNTANPWADNEVANNLTIDDAGIASTIARDAEVTALLVAFADTFRVAVWSVGMGNTDLDTITTGSFGGIKIENNYTITEVSAYTNTGTITFNIEERAEVTPNTTGVDVITSDLVADTDQQETGTFSNAAIDINDWLVLTIVSITGDPTVFSVTVRGVKTN